MVFPHPSRPDESTHPTTRPSLPFAPRNPHKYTQAPLLSQRYTQHSPRFTFVVRVFGRTLMAQTLRTGCQHPDQDNASSFSRGTHFHLRPVHPSPQLYIRRVGDVR